MKPILILAQPGDRLALRICANLQHQAGPESVRLVTVQELVLAPNWHHRHSGCGVTTKIRLADGFLLDHRFGVVFNRLQQIDLPHFAGADPADRGYALAEMQALLLSWLHSLPCPVINPASPQGLGGVRRTHAQWMQLAHAAELPIQAYHFSTNPRQLDPRRHSLSTLVPFSRLLPTRDRQLHQLEPVKAHQIGSNSTFYLEEIAEERRTVLVAGERVVGPIDGVDLDGVKQLAMLARCPLLQIALARRRAEAEPKWVVCGVTPFPLVEDADAVRVMGDLLIETALAAPPPGAVFAMRREAREARETGTIE